MRPHRIALFASLLLATLTISAQSNGAAPVVTFTETAITASGITKGKTALIYGIGVQRSGYDQLFVRVLQEVADDDGDGVVTLPFADGLPHGAVWAVFDLTNNQYTIAASPGFVPAAVELPRNAFRRGGAGNAVVRFAFDHPSLELLYVHPGKGVWSWSAMDGRALDRDGANGVTTVDAADGKRASGTDRDASEFAPGGTLIAVDWYKQQYAAVRLDGTLLGGAQ